VIAFCASPIGFILITREMGDSILTLVRYPALAGTIGAECKKKNLKNFDWRSFANSSNRYMAA